MNTSDKVSLQTTTNLLKRFSKKYYLSALFIGETWMHWYHTIGRKFENLANYWNYLSMNTSDRVSLQNTANTIGTGMYTVHSNETRAKLGKT